jgi:hypothetical protein
MGAVEQPAVALRERVWNERHADSNRENAGVYGLLGTINGKINKQMTPKMQPRDKQERSLPLP